MKFKRMSDSTREDTEAFISRTYYPCEPLKPFIKHYWYLKINTNSPAVTERVIPQDTIEMMFHFKDPFYNQLSSGPLKQPRFLVSGLSTDFVDVTASSPSEVLSVSFYPLGASWFFNFPLAELGSKALDLKDIDHVNIRVLESKIFETQGIEKRIDIIEDFLLKQLCPLPRLDMKIMSQSINLIKAQKGSIRSKDLAFELGLSQKSLERKFLKFIGKPPKQFGKIIRFQQLIDFFSVRNWEKFLLTDLAYEFGYFDQAHFNREFKTMSGLTPRHFFSRYYSHNRE